MEEEFDNEEYLNSLPPGVREDLESGNEGAWTVGPAEIGAGLMIAPGLVTKAAKTWGTGRVLEAGLNLIAPDAEDNLLDRALDFNKPAKVGVKATRLMLEKIFDQRVSPEDLPSLNLAESHKRHPQITKLSDLKKQARNRRILDETSIDDGYIEEIVEQGDDVIYPEGSIEADIQANTQALGPEKFNQTELKLEPFQSNTYQRSVLSKMNKYGMGDGTFRMKAYTAYLNKGDEGRDMLEAYLSPDRLRGSFEGYKKFNKKSVEYKWGAFLEKKGYNLSQGIQVHHINPLFDSIHLFDNVKFNSKEYWDLMDILIKNNARTGAIQKGDDINNLMMTLGQATDEATPHGIAHKFYNNFTPTFFSPAEMKKMNTVKGYRKKKAKRWATLVNKSEEVILEAHKQWSLLNPVTASQLPFDELVERLSKLDARGYNKLMDPKYQLPDMNSIIKEIAADKGLKGPIYRLNPPPVQDPSKITLREKMTKEGDIINELRGMNKKPKPINPDQINIDDIFPDE